MIKNTVVLLAGFGGPTSPAEVKPFLRSVLEGTNIPESRREEVLRHYEAVGGVSHYNSTTEMQRKALEVWLKNEKWGIPVLAGFLHSEPSFKNIFMDLKKRGTDRVVGVVLSSFRAYASFDKYKIKIEEAKKETGTAGIEMIYTEAFYNHPLFIEAQAERILEATRKIPSGTKDKTMWMCSAHSIPIRMSQQSSYAEEFVTAATQVAKRLGQKDWGLGYQSRSGRLEDRWLEPNVMAMVEKLDKRRFKNVVFVPIGFLCDNVEVTYDLDIEAKNFCGSLGLHYSRAATVGDHPKFIEMLANVIASAAKQSPGGFPPQSIGGPADDLMAGLRRPVVRRDSSQ